MFEKCIERITNIVINGENTRKMMKMKETVKSMHINKKFSEKRIKMIIIYLNIFTYIEICIYIGL